MFVLRRTLRALAGGIVLFLAFPDVGWWWAAPLGVAALFLVTRTATARGGFWYGWVFGMAFLLPHLWWAYVAVGPVPWIALSGASSVAYGAIGAVHAFLWKGEVWGRHAWLEPVAFATVWVGGELLRQAVPFGGFPWGRVAFATAEAPFSRYAWLGGAPLTSFVVVLVGALVAQTWVAVRERRVVAALATPLAVVALALAPLGLPLDDRAETGTLSVAWVQGNLADEGLDSFARAREVTRNHVEATLELAAAQGGTGVDLVVWPENASDIDPRADAETADAVTEAAQAFGVPLLLGTNDFSPPEGRYNLSLVWLPSGEALPGAEYRKQIPAAFAEYVPIRDFARRFSAEVDRVTSDVLPGTDPARIDIPVASLGRDVRVGTIICFEVAYDRISRQAATESAEFLAIQTNNATFGPTAESTQQLAMSRLRAIETGKATLQVSTVGVSAVIMPDGSVIDESALFTRDGGVAAIPLRTSMTPAATYGAVGEVAWAGAAAALALAAVFRRFSGRRT